VVGDWFVAGGVGPDGVAGEGCPCGLSPAAFGLAATMTWADVLWVLGGIVFGAVVGTVVGLALALESMWKR
jgi:hypothetical protein